MQKTSKTPREYRAELKKVDICSYKKNIEQVKESMNSANYRPGTVKSYRSYLIILSAWLVLHCSSVTFQEITIDNIQCFIDFLKNMLCLAPATINCYLAAIRMMFSLIRNEDLNKRILPDLIVDRKLPRVPSVEEVGLMLKACEEDPLALLMISMLSSTGMRFSEMISLHFSNIKSSTKQILINVSKGRNERLVPLTDRTKGILSDYCIEYNSQHSNEKLLAEDFVFFNADRSNHLSDQKLRTVFKKVLETAGLSDKGYTPHSLRHFFALQYYLQSHDLLLIKRLLGHSTLAATEVYLLLATAIDVQNQYTNPADLAFDATVKK